MRNHLIMGGIAGLKILDLFPIEVLQGNSGNLVFFASCLFGSIAPDLDEPESKTARMLKLGILAEIIKSISGGHRGLTHTLFFAFILNLIVGLFVWLDKCNYFVVFLIGLSVGIITHQIGDLFTKSGIVGWSNPLVFIPKIRKNLDKEGIPIFRVSGIFESWIISPLLIGLLIYVFFQLGDKFKMGILF